MLVSDCLLCPVVQAQQSSVTADRFLSLDIQVSTSYLVARQNGYGLLEEGSFRTSFSAWEPGGCFSNVSRALQNNLAKIYNSRNNIYADNFKLKICTCTQSMALVTRTKFQLEILIRNTILVIYKFRENILESARNVCETPPDRQHVWQAAWTSDIPTCCHIVHHKQPVFRKIFSLILIFLLVVILLGTY